MHCVLRAYKYFGYGDDVGVVARRETVHDSAHKPSHTTLQFVFMQFVVSHAEHMSSVSFSPSYPNICLLADICQLPIHSCSCTQSHSSDEIRSVSYA